MEAASHKPTLVLDLDGTLVSACDWRRCNNNTAAYDFEVTIGHSETFIERLLVKKRPGLDTFLAEMAKLYDVIVFSYSVAPYVDGIMDVIDHGGQLVSHRLSHDSCPNGVKRLDSPIFESRDLRRLLWLDDSPGAFVDHPENGIVVPHFNVEKAISQGINPAKDTLLRELTPFLQSIATSQDFTKDLAAWKAKASKLSRRTCNIL